MNRVWLGANPFFGLLFIFIFVLASCNSDDSRKYNEYERSIQLMDQGFYNEAIFLMDQRLQRNSKDLQARKLLAAAYAGRGGVQLKQYIDLSEIVIKSFRESEIKPETDVFSLADNLQIKATTKEAEEANQLLKQLSQWLKAIKYLEEIITAFNQIPKISDSIHAADIEMAVQTLTVGKESEFITLPPEMSLYRGLLRLTLLNFNIRHTFDWSNPTKCSVDMRELIDQAEVIYTEISLVLRDVAKSSSSQSSKLRILNMVDRLDGNFKNFKDNSSSLESQLTISLIDGELKSRKGCP